MFSGQVKRISILLYSKSSDKVIDSVAMLISDIHKQFYKKEYLAALFLDIKEAYNSVSSEIIKLSD